MGIPVCRAASSKERPFSRRALSRRWPVPFIGLSSYELFSLKPVDPF
jgi:hypothetical protein